jgi:hypothetical protein
MSKTRAERREEIATRLLVAYCSNPNSEWPMDRACVAAARYASLLLDELDNEAANDKQKGGE